MGLVRHLTLPAMVVAGLLWAQAAQANHSYGATYSGTHQQGGSVQFDVNADGTAITRIYRSNVQGDVCTFGESTTTGNIPIDNHAFTFGGTSSAFQFSGTFHAPQQAQGTLRIRTFGPGACDSGTLTWSASTTVPPPGGAPPPPPPPGPGPAPTVDTTPPVVGVSASRSRRIGRGRIPIRVSCPAESCHVLARGTISFRGTAATFRLRSATVDVGAGQTVTATLRVPRRALAAAKRALEDGRRVTARISVLASDAAGNQAPTVRRSIRLRR